MKKVQKVLISALCVALGAGALIACGGDDNNNNNGDGKLTVTFYDATGTNKPAEMTVVKTIKVDKNSTITVGADGKVDDYAPTKDGGYEFIDWYATPNKTHKFDFSEAITENISVYGGFSKYVADTRDFYVIGAGTSNVLIDGWGKLNDNHKLTKTADKNEYKITLDLRENDQFVIVENADYHYKHGAGYLVSSELADGTAVFEGQGSVFDDSFWGANIKVKHDGNYTLTLNTHPNEDWYDENGNNYTEATKEVYARNPYDTIDWVRNGDPLVELDIITDYYIKGSKITDWKDMYNPATKMTSDNGVYTLEVYLQKGEEFLFSSTNTVGTQVSVGAEFLRSSILDEASKAYLDETANKNMVAKEAGTYTFTYTEATGKLTVAYNADKAPTPADYYIDGTFADGVADWSGYCFNADYKLTETEAGSGVYELNGVTMKADSQIIIQAFKLGSTERGEWGTDGYNGLGSYNYFYLYGGGEKFSAVGDGNNNIKVVTAGTYDITFNSYSKMITITQHIDSADTLDIYIKGENINGWSHGWSADYLMTLAQDEATYEYTLTVEANKAVTFGLEKHPKGETAGYGDYLGTAAMGAAGDANAAFTPESGSNFVCSTAGTYKIVYTIATGKVDFYVVTAE